MLLVMSAGGCAGRWAYRQGQAEAKNGNWDMAVARLTKALQQEPANIDYKIALENAKIQASRLHHENARKLLAANQLEQASEEFEIAAKYDPANQAFAADYKLSLVKIRKREEDKKQRDEYQERQRRANEARVPVPALSARSPVPISINMPDASLQKVFETLAQLAGVNILFDESFHDKNVSVKLNDVTFQEALDQLVLVHKLFYKVLDQNTLIVVADMPQWRRKFDESLMRTFYLQNADANELQNVVRMLIQSSVQPPKIAPNQALRALTVMGTADELALAARIIEAHDKPVGEVLVEVEILDVNRQSLKNYGIELANRTGSITFDPNGTGGTVRAHLLSSLNLADFVVNIPNQLLVKFLQNESTARILASPKLRGAEGKPTALRIGTEVPMPVTTITVTQPGAGGFGAPATSFQYRNVGVNMELTPRVNAEGEVTFDPLNAEFSLIGADRDVGGGLKVPTFLTRNVRGTLRVRDGETALLGGLLQGEDRESFAGIIGLQSIPVLNRLLGTGNPGKSHDEFEIIISITPHVVRGPRLSDDDLKAFYAGTKETIRVPSARPPLFAPEEVTLDTPAAEATPATTTTTTTTTTTSATTTTTAPPVVPGVEGAPPAPTPQPTPVPVTGTESAAIPTPLAEGGPAPGGVAPVGAVPPEGAAPAAEAPPDEPSVMVLFSPPEVAIKVGEVQALSVIVLRVKELVSVDLALTYDPTAITAEDAEPGSLLTLDGSTVSSEKNLDPGRVRVRFARSAPTAKTPSSGAITLARFRGVKPGPTTVTIESLSLITPRGRERVTLPGPGRIVVLP